MLKKDPETMWLPIVSATVLVLVMLPFLLLLFGAEIPVFGPVLPILKVPLLIQLLALFGLYIVSYFIVIYFNTAVVGMANIRLAGGDPVVRDGLAVARENVKAILVWAVISATVSLALLIASAVFKRAGRLITSLAGLAWSIATYFVVPVIVFEKIRPWAAVRRSVQILKGTWGEAIVGGLGVDLVIFVKALLGLAFLLGGMALWLLTGSWIPFAIGLVGAVVWWAYIVAMSMAAENILLTALYRYGTGQKVEGFPVELLKNPWIKG